MFFPPPWVGVFFAPIWFFLKGKKTKNIFLGGKTLSEKKKERVDN